MPNRIQAEAALWEQVWAEYDARKQQAPVAAMAARAPTPRRAPRHWGRRLRGMAALCIVLSATAYAIAPMLAAARLGEALAAGDAGVLEQVVDWRQVHAVMAQDMAAATQGHGPGATAFLAGMAGDVAQGLASPAGLVALLRDRMPRQ